MKNRPEGTPLRRRAEKMVSKRRNATDKASSAVTQKLVHELRVHQLELEMQNDELRKAQEIIEESRQKYVSLYDFAPIGYFTLTGAGSIVDANLFGAKLLGCERSRIVGNPFACFVAKDFQPLFRAHCAKVLAGRKKEACELKIIKEDGSSFHASLDSTAMANDGGGKIHTVLTDITERNRAEEETRRFSAELESRVSARTEQLTEANNRLQEEIRERKLVEETREVTVALLRLCNLARSSRDLMERLARHFQQLTDCEAVGVRLREGDDFPYYETLGFSKEFVLAESKLCAVDVKGERVRDRAGHPVLDCMCGNILSGRFDPAKPFFSPRGSFWSNCTTELLASTTEAERQARTRNRCNGEGYESVALIPLQAHGETFGLFQFNDRQKGRFSPGKIALLEDLVDYVAIVLAKLKSDEALREAGQFSRQIIDNAEEGIIVHGPDLSFQAWNPFMEKLTGWTADEVLGRYPIEIFPFLREAGVINRLEKALLGESSGPLEFPYHYPKSGRSGWLSDHYAPLRNSNGEVIGVIAMVRDISNRKRAEEELRRTSHWLLASQRISATGCWAIDLKTGAVWASPEARRIYGADERTLTVPFIQAFPLPQYRQTLDRALEELVKANKPYEIEFQITRGTDGAIVDIHSLAEYNATEHVVLGVVRDVTELNKMMGALRDRDEKYRTLLDTMNEGYYETDLEGRFTLLNGALAQMRGKSQEALLGARAVEFTDPETERRVEKYLTDTYQGVRPNEFCEMELIPAAGEKRTHEFSAYLIQDREGKKLGFRGIVRDISDRKKAEEALRQSEEKYRIIAENTAVIIAIIDMNLRFTYISPSVMRIRGFTVEEAMSQTFDQVMTPESLKTVFTAFEEEMKLEASGSADPRRTRTMELEEYRKDGSAFLVEVDLSFLRDKDHKPIAILSTTRDITERKRAEKALRGSEEAARKLAMENEVLSEIGRITSSTLDSHDLYKGFDAEARKIIAFDRIVINRINTGKGVVRNVYIAGGAVPNREPEKTYPLEGSGNAEMVRTKSTVLIQTEDFDALKARFPMIVSTFQAGFRSIMNVPLFSKGEIIGGLLLRSRKPYAYTDRDVKTAERIANQIAGAVANARLFEDLKEAEDVLKESEAWAKILARENAIMAEIGEIVSSSLDMRSVYPRFAEAVRKIIPFDRIAINIVNSDRRAFTIPYVLGPQVEERKEGEVIPLKGTMVEHMLQTGSGILIGREEVETYVNRFPGISPLVRDGLHSMIFVPLSSEGKVIGVLNLQLAGETSYSESYLKLAQRVGTQIAGAAANMELFRERKLIEKELSDSEERYRNLVELSPLMILVHRQRKYVYANPAAVKALGATRPEDLIGKSIFEIIHPDYWDIVTGRIGVLEQGKIAPAVEEKFIRLDKRMIDVEVTNVKTLHQDEPMILVIARDITQQKRAEKEKIVLQEQLQQAQKMEAIGTLAGGIAHDFNNILAAILGYAELASLEVEEGSKVAYNLQQSMKAGHRAKELVKQILTFARQGKEERKLLDVRPIVKEGLKFLRASLPATIQIRQEIEEDLGLIKADPTQIHQVLMNLCTNAGHAMAERGGVLEVALSKADLDGTSNSEPSVEPGRYLRLRVKDSGHGISPEILKRIFDPYFTTKEPGKGTGLGLSVVHGIVKSYGGGIRVSSEVGKGSTFDIHFPRVEEVETRAKTESVGLIALGGRERLLLVDDEAPIVEIGKETLEHLGYEVVARTSSVEALELFKATSDRFDLVITDLTMPNMTGEKLAQELMRIRPGIPIILCTGFSEHFTEERAKALGIREFVMKPLVIKELAQAVRGALDFRKKTG